MRVTSTGQFTSCEPSVLVVFGIWIRLLDELDLSTITLMAHKKCAVDQYISNVSVLNMAIRITNVNVTCTQHCDLGTRSTPNVRLAGG